MNVFNKKIIYVGILSVISLSLKLDVNGFIYNNRNLCRGDFKRVANARDSGFLLKGALPPPGGCEVQRSFGMRSNLGRGGFRYDESDEHGNGDAQPDCGQREGSAASSEHGKMLKRTLQ